MSETEPIVHAIVVRSSDLVELRIVEIIGEPRPEPAGHAAAAETPAEDQYLRIVRTIGGGPAQ